MKKWLALIASFFLMAVPYSMVNTIHSLFINPVIQENGFSLSSFSFLFTLSAIVMAVASPLIGRLIGSVGLRPVMTVGAVLTGGGFFAYGYAHSIPMFYLIAAVVAIGITALTVIPVSTMVTSWFPEKRGSMIGLAFAGTGTGTFFWMQLVSRLLLTRTPGQVYRMLGVIILAVAVPLCLFFVSLSGKAQANAGAAAQKAASHKSLFSGRSFLLFSGGIFLMGMIISGIQVHVQPFLGAIGLPAQTSANIGSLLAISALGGTLLGGWLFDRIGPQRSLLTIGLLSLVSLACLLLGERGILLYLFALTYGLSLCLPSLWPSFGVARLFSGHDYSSTLGIVNMFLTAGGAIGPFLSGVIADSAHGYPAAWWLYLALTVVYYLLFLLCLKTGKGKQAA